MAKGGQGLAQQGLCCQAGRMACEDERLAPNRSAATDRMLTRGNGVLHCICHPFGLGCGPARHTSRLLFISLLGQGGKGAYSAEASSGGRQLQAVARQAALPV